MLVAAAMSGKLGGVWGLLALVGVWIALFASVVPQPYELQVDGLMIRRGLRRSHVSYRSMAKATSMDGYDSIYTVEIATKKGDWYFDPSRRLETVSGGVGETGSALPADQRA